jgi:hypothetical protein
VVTVVNYPLNFCCNGTSAVLSIDRLILLEVSFRIHGDLVETLGSVARTCHFIKKYYPPNMHMPFCKK